MTVLSPPAWPLQISADGHHLVDSHGTPFLYWADTAWEMLHRLTLDEARNYLQVRARQGFTVIQTVVLAEIRGLTEPNAQGDLPLHDLDPTQPQERYFTHVDAILTEAARLGLVIGLLPTWGDKVEPLARGDGPVIFTAANAEAWGQWLATRYRELPVVWILGGDRNPANDAQRAVWHAMASGIQRAYKDHQPPLITYHPEGSSSSRRWFDEAPWLRLHMTQSGHTRRGLSAAARIAEDYAATPPKPVVDGEVCYEGMPVDFWTHLPGRRWPQLTPQERALLLACEDFRADEVVRTAAEVLFAGAVGVAYGHNAVWQMWTPGRTPNIPTTVPWHGALDSEGARCFCALGAFARKHHLHTWQPRKASAEPGIANVQGDVRLLHDGAGRLALLLRAKANLRFASAPAVQLQECHEMTPGPSGRTDLSAAGRLQSWTAACDQIIIVSTHPAIAP